MAFTDTFIKRPVFACVISLLILLIGIVSYFKLPVRLFPKITSSVVSIRTNYTGASAKLMEGFVTAPIENAISSVDGIDFIKSESSSGSSEISAHMKEGYDINKSANDIANKVHMIRWKLPKDIQDPIVVKHDADAQPIMWLGFDSNILTDEQITDYLTRIVQPKLQTQPGVSEASILGGSEYAMRIWLNPQLMAAHHVTATDVEEALKNNNIQSASGRISAAEQEYNIYSTTDLKTVQQFNNLVVRHNSNKLVRIKDIGKAELGASEDRFSVKINGKKAVFIGILPKANANPLTISKEIRAQLKQVKSNLPPELHGKLYFDSADYISNSLHEVKSTIIEACIFVFLIIFLMLGSFRSVFIPFVTIPLAMIGACSVMLALGFSLNVLTFLAWVLAIGLVVDDSIVVLENIHRHVVNGMPAKEAALTGAREIMFAIIAMTLTLAAVYAPIGFVKGFTGKLFIEFAFTLASAMILSGFIALTLSPMLCSKVYKNYRPTYKGLEGFSNRLFTRLKNTYQKTLRITLKCWPIVLIIAFAIYGSCYALYTFTPKELAPAEDQGVLFSIVSAPASANLNYTEKHTQKLTELYKTIPEITNSFTINGMPNGVSSAFSIVILKPWNQRTKSSMQLSQALFPLLWSIPGITAFAANPPSLPGTGGFSPINLVLKTTDSYKNLLKNSAPFVEAVKSWHGLLNVDLNLKIDRPQTVIDIHRNIAADLGIPMNDIAQSLNTFLGTPTITRFDRQGKSYDVIPQLYEQYRNTPRALNNLSVRTMSGQLVPLSNLVNITEQVVPRTLNHFQQLRSLTLSAHLAPGVTEAGALKHLNQLAKKLLPQNIQTDYAGQSRQYIQSAGKMMMIFLLALLFIYLILAAQFESFRDPFIVMLSVPLSLAGALLLLFLTHGTINVYTEIGLITLVGLITKNGILIVEFANQQQARGLNIHDAIIQGATLRLRPILMTTMVMLLGALPLALASGAGAVSRRQLGLVILGGMSIGTFFTLFIVPTVYYLFATKKSVIK